MQLAQPLNFLGGAYRVTLQGLIDMNKLETLMQLQSSMVPGTKEFEFRGGGIKFKNVAFRSLKDVDFEVQPGTKVGIVGPSGSGKSTILKLLCRFNDPDKGEILLDNQALHQLEPTSFTNYMGIVPQESVLFNDSVTFNLKYGNAEATDEQIEKACKMAQVHDVIMRLPDGYDTRVGERGAKLSGGERQRIAIARCLLRSPEILVFDEATASLDLETESKLAHAIDSFVGALGDRTMVIVAHRLSTIKKCDQILYLDEGRILERGTHDELINKPDGRYRHLWDIHDSGSSRN